jgi:hypothetical protein
MWPDYSRTFTDHQRSTIKAQPAVEGIALDHGRREAAAVQGRPRGRRKRAAHAALPTCWPLRPAGLQRGPAPNLRAAI